ncbi:MAG: DUF4199 domain-containing protein [Balneolaceae bacterium]
MENENIESTNQSYWTSVLIGGLISALILSVLGLVSQYMTVSSEPVGSSFTLSQAIGTFACLLGAIGGFIATRHYAKEYDITFPIGKGALIGLFTGLVAMVISTLITLLWTSLIDPDINQAVYDWSIANLEAQNMTEDQMEMAKGFIPEPGISAVTVGIGLLMLGILNAISGLIGAKVFASEED